ncbi:hypothetical protein [Comamonas koreensis]|uniref:DUF1902 domain-containing protein n=1 Tax=Comamonas koreensis TaxID=160825 RepID=A0AAW4XUC7_9BURK|nr:hypothetical protein [Comamonas koreensis]MCD2164316.1 hypothetical protein [Comamonas koreensis]
MFNGYRVGWPLWKTVARTGAPIRFRVLVHFDEESKTLWADSPDIDGLVVSGNNMDELRAAALSSANDLLDLELNTHKIHAQPDLGIDNNCVHA